MTRRENNNVWVQGIIFPTNSRGKNKGCQDVMNPLNMLQKGDGEVFV
jgi:hypothetical protein